MPVPVTQLLIDRLRAAGIETLYGPQGWTLPDHVVLEPPCSLKWMSIERSLTLGAFSYAVSGYFHGAIIGRYCSIGEQVQVGRSDHPVAWLSTSPVFYLGPHLFSVGNGFPGADRFHALPANQFPPERPPTVFRPVTIGNDVWIGHGAYLRPGITVGDGAIIAAHAVVVKDVPPYAVVAGNPAVVKKMRFAEPLVAGLLAAQWWRFAPWHLAGIDVTRPEAALDALFRLAAETPSYTPPLVHLRDLAQV